MAEPVTEIRCIRIVDGSQVTMLERVATEAYLDLNIDNHPSNTFLFTTGYEEQLVIGYLLTSGIIKGLDDIGKLEIDNTTCRVTLSHAPISKSSTTKSSISTIAYHEILAGSEVLRTNQKQHHATRAFHAAIIIDLATEQWFTCEDIGRHNAVDKVIGFSLKEGYQLSNSLLILTGRLTYQIVEKCVTAGIPIVASLTVATSEGINIAKKSDTTLLGALSSEGSWLYHEGKIRIQL